MDGGTVFADYRRGPGLVEITHVEAPPALRGTGLAGKLMEGVVQAARRDGLRIRPLCGYAYAWMRRHKEYRDLLA